MSSNETADTLSCLKTVEHITAKETDTVSSSEFNGN